MSGCNHTVGTAIVEYQLDILNADDDGGEPHENSFGAFNYCPYCGKDVSAEANAVRDRIKAHWETFWKRYAEQHGEAEMRRARRL